MTTHVIRDAFGYYLVPYESGRAFARRPSAALRFERAEAIRIAEECSAARERISTIPGVNAVSVDDLRYARDLESEVPPC